MKFVVSQKQLMMSIKAVNKCLSRRPHLPILGGIHLVAKEKQLELTSTDMTVGLRVKIAAEVEVDGETTLNGKNLVDAVSFFDGKETTFESDDKQMLVKNGRDRVKIPVMVDEFPDFDESRQEEEIVKKEVAFWEGVDKNVAFAASSDQSRPALTGVLFRQQVEKTQIVCTDGFRLTIWETGEKVSNLDSLEVIVNAKAIGDTVAIADILEEKKIGFYYNAAAEQVLFIGENFVFFSKLINAAYPPFEKIVPLEFSTEATLVREELMRNLTKASVFTRADSNTVKLHLNDAGAEFNAASLGDGSFNGSQEMVKFSGEELDIAFNIKYLQDFLSTCHGETVTLGCNGSIAPAMLKDPGVPEMTYVVMPFKPKN